MATLVLSAVGTALGGPLGGAIGALAGRQVDFAILGSGRTRGPRLQDLSVQTSSYGAPIPLQFGTMRVAGSVIWATDLVEHSQVSGGKARPTVTSYSYTVSFAVALSSRPILGIGRVWADGTLLRGAAGDLKVSGDMRIHSGFGDQPLDPLLAQAEGMTRSPAYRHCAHVVFEDLALATFGNRIPSLTFEVFADPQPLELATLLRALVPDATVTGFDEPITGFTVDRGTIADTLDTVSGVLPISCVVNGESLLIKPAEDALDGAAMLPAPAAGGPKSDAVQATGWSRQRDALPQAAQCGVRYYDVDRDFQPGLQQSVGRSTLGDVAVVEFPAALDAGAARQLAQAASRRRSRARDALRYRVTEIDSEAGPGAIVQVPVAEGLWRIDQWEWQADGVLLDLDALPTSGGISAIADAGRSHAQADNLPSPTILDAFELPWDGAGNGDVPALFVAATSAGAGWSGAALFAARTGGAVVPLGSTGTRRVTAGTVVGTMAAASPHLIDRSNRIEVDLTGPGLALEPADFNRLCQGANLALVGDELIQFGSVDWLSPERARLSNLLRGRGGTEWAVGTHGPDERFTLVEGLVRLDASTVGDAGSVQILASGLGDPAPATCPIRGVGATTRPLSPVHGHAARMPDGSIQLSWIRRARGAFAWPDQVDIPVNEQAERYEVAFVSSGTSELRWIVTVPELILDVGIAQALANGSAPITFHVSQLGNTAASLPLTIALQA